MMQLQHKSFFAFLPAPMSIKDITGVGLVVINQNTPGVIGIVSLMTMVQEPKD